MKSNTYHAELNIETGTISTDIYYTDIIDEFIGFFPINSAKLLI